MAMDEVFRRGRIVHHLSFPLLPGRQAVFLAGREAQYLETYSAEVAEKSAVGVPRVSVLWSGLAGRLSLTGSQPRVDLEHHWADTPVLLETGAKDNGPVERVHHRRVEFLQESSRDGRLWILGEGAGERRGQAEWRVVAALLLS